VLLVVVAIAGTMVSELLVQTPPVGGLAEPPPVVKYGVLLCRLLLDLSIVGAMGLALLAKFIGFDNPDRSEPVVARARRLAVVASWVWVGAALLSVVLLSAEVFPDAFPGPSFGALDILAAPYFLLRYVFSSPNLIWEYISSVPAGKGLLVSAGFGLLSVVICRVSIRRGESVPAELRAGVAAFGLLPLPLTGHASPWKYHDLVMMSMELHIIAAAAWVGGLASCVLFLVRRPALLATALPSFSRLATYCVFAVAATGLFTALAMLSTATTTVMPEAIWTTPYGQLALAKMTCIGIVGAVAVTVRRGMLVRIIDRKPTAVAVWCGFELVVMFVAYGIAIVLTRSAPV
jgi:putative copper resistance protein D